MGRDLLSLEAGSPLSPNLLRFGLLYILQRKVSKAFRSSVVLFDNATFGTIDRYPKLKETEKKKFREHHQLGDKEYLVFLVRMDNPKHSALQTQKQQQLYKVQQGQRQTSQTKASKARQKRKRKEEDEEDEMETGEEKDDDDDDGRSSVDLSGSEDAENQRWHWYLAIVTDITAYQGPPITGSSALYSTIIFLDANPSLGAAHYKWASAGVRGYLHDIYEDLHGIEMGVRLNYRYPRLSAANTGVSGNAHDSSSSATSLIVKNRQNHTYTEGVKGTTAVSAADSGLLLLAYFEAFMRKDLFRERAAKGVPLGAICVFPRNAPTFDGLTARLTWRVALFSVIDFSEAHFSRESLLKQLRWTEKMLDQKELEKAGVKCWYLSRQYFDGLNDESFCIFFPLFLLCQKFWKVCFFCFLVWNLAFLNETHNFNFSFLPDFKKYFLKLKKWLF